MLASLLLGIGTMVCVMLPDGELTALAVMVTAGVLGGIASRNAALPRLAITQICLGTLPVAIGALFAPRAGSWILVPPLFAYIVAMVSVVRRHYSGLVAIMAEQQANTELAARFDAALTYMPHGLCTIDEAGKVIIANRRTAELFGATVDMLPLNVPLPEFVGYVGRRKFEDASRRQLVQRCTQWLSGKHGPLEIELNDGRRLEMTRSAVPDGSAVIIIEDVTERRKSEATILRLAHHDPLTGLANRRHLRHRLEQILDRQTAGDASSLALMYIDLDSFKAVNDRLGHHTGDLLIQAVADRLRRALRGEQLVARLGGDEFIVVVENATAEGCAAMARRIIRRISRPYTFSPGTTALIGASIGIALGTDDDSAQTLMKRADIAMYVAKQAGRGTFHFSSRTP